MVEVGVHPVRLFPSANLAPLGRRWHCRVKPGGASQHVEVTRGTFHWATKHQFRRERRAAPSSTSEGSAEPLRARIKGANRGGSEGKADL